MLSQSEKVFTSVALALEAETIQGGVAARVVQAVKVLLGISGRDPAQLMSQLSPETQDTVRAFFS